MYGVSRRDERPEPQSIWDRPEPAVRRPSHTREGIARAAIEVADSDGFEAVTMRNVAAELGAGTMTLYHYVRTKDELFALVDNALMGEVRDPRRRAFPTGWRAGTREIARRTRDVFARHPWIAEMPRNFDDGPNAVLHMEQSIAVMAETGLPLPRVPGADPPRRRLRLRLHRALRADPSSRRQRPGQDRPATRRRPRAPHREARSRHLPPRPRGLLRRLPAGLDRKFHLTGHRPSAASTEAWKPSWTASTSVSLH